MGTSEQLSLGFDDSEQPPPVTARQATPDRKEPVIAPERPAIPSLITSGVIAAMLGDERHRVKRVLATREDLRPVAMAGRTRLYRPEVVARVRHELNAIDARLSARRERKEAQR